MRLLMIMSLLCVTGCAPMIVTRTPEVLASGETAIALSSGWSIGLTRAPECSEPCPPKGNGFDNYPVASPFAIGFIRGMGSQTDLRVTLEVGLTPGFRVGGLSNVLDKEFRLAVDYGLALYVVNGTLDVGLIASYLTPQAEPYLALRTIGSVSWADFPADINVAFTSGVRIPGHSVDYFLELTLATTDDFANSSFVEPATGFSLTPAFGVRF